MAKSEYAIFRSTHTGFLFDYLHSIEGYRSGVQQYTKSSENKDLRKALIVLFCEQGNSFEEAESTADLNLTKGYDDETHMEELITLLNAKTSITAEVDPILELQIYLIKKAMMMQNPDPSFAMITKQIETNAKRPSESLHKLWRSHSDSSAVTEQFETEEAFRLY